MKILIVYGTGEGHTRKVARFMEEVLQEENHKVVIADATEDPPSPFNFDIVLIGASVHMNKYQNSIHAYVMDNIDELGKKRSAFFSVSMAMASDNEAEHEEIRAVTIGFLQQSGWVPDETFYLAGALKYIQYDYFKRLIMRMIMKKKGGETDTSHDYEYTDWDAVKVSVLDFVNTGEV